MTTQAKPSALEALKALAQKKPVASTSAIATQINDPAIAGAQKGKGASSVVTLGFDPAFAEKAAQCADLNAALKRAEADFKILQAETRDYGASKRGVYNKTFKASVTTVKVPYEIDTPAGKEKQYISVICSNRYSVNGEVIQNNRDLFGDSFSRLFVEETTKSLKPNAEELIRGIIKEAGLDDEAVEAAMQQLFDTTVKIKASENYEQEAEKVDSSLKTILEQSVNKAEPGLKF